MGYVLKQIPISCPNCGEFLFRTFKESYDLNTKKESVIEGDPKCQKCHTRDYILLLKSAEKIEMLKPEDVDYTYKGTAQFGEKVVKVTGRKLKDVQEPQ